MKNFNTKKTYTIKITNYKESVKFFMMTVLKVNKVCNICQLNYKHFQLYIIY